MVYDCRMKKNFEKPTYNYQSILDVDLASNKIGNLTGKLTFILSDNDFVTLSRREIPKYYDAAPVIGRVKGYDNCYKYVCNFFFYLIG